MSVDTLLNYDLFDMTTQKNQNEEITNENIDECVGQVSLWQLVCPCPICKVKCNEGTERILCRTCKNWFHFECSNLSKSSYDKFLQDPNKMFLCKVCKIKTVCTKCKCSLKSPSESLYCVGCLNKCCRRCLDLTISQIKILKTTEKAYFCAECSVDHFCNVCDKLCVDGCIFCDNCYSSPYRYFIYTCTVLFVHTITDNNV